jgi:hypothetical protein
VAGFSVVLVAAVVGGPDRVDVLSGMPVVVVVWSDPAEAGSPDAAVVVRSWHPPAAKRGSRRATAVRSRTTNMTLLMAPLPGDA